MSDDLLVGQVRGLDRRLDILENGEEDRPGVAIRLLMLEKQVESNTELMREMVSNSKAQRWFNITLIAICFGIFLILALYGAGMFSLFAR